MNAKYGIPASAVKVVLAAQRLAKKHFTKNTVLNQGEAYEHALRKHDGASSLAILFAASYDRQIIHLRHASEREGV